MMNEFNNTKATLNAGLPLIYRTISSRTNPDYPVPLNLKYKLTTNPTVRAGGNYLALS
jgi:hypothetical protein